MVRTNTHIIIKKQLRERHQDEVSQPLVCMNLSSVVQQTENNNDNKRKPSKRFRVTTARVLRNGHQQ